MTRAVGVVPMLVALALVAVSCFRIGHTAGANSMRPHNLVTLFHTNTLNGQTVLYLSTYTHGGALRDTLTVMLPARGNLLVPHAAIMWEPR